VLYNKNNTLIVRERVTVVALQHPKNIYRHKSYADLANALSISEEVSIPTERIKSNIRKYEALIPKWVSLYKSGESFGSIAKAEGVAPNTVRRYILPYITPRKPNISKGKKEQVISEKKTYPINEWVNKFNNGFSYSELSKEYSVPYSIVYQKIRKRVKTKKTLYDIYGREWYELRMSGKSFGQLEIKYGYPRAKISQVVSKYKNSILIEGGR
jgi:hypothetical protein